MGKISINIKTGTFDKKEPIIGIDLGTTNSLIAYIDEETKEAKIIPLNNQPLVPSMIYFGLNGEVLVGTKAKDKQVDFPLQTIQSVKRLLGKSYKDVENLNKTSYKIIETEGSELVKIEVNGIFYSPIELSALILKELKTQAEIALGVEVVKAVITVPAYFNESQRQATKDAGKIAGLNVLRIINEPTAASLAYGLQANFDKLTTVLVYDFGGGTLDVSILKIEGGIFEVLSTHGNTQLGGDDITYAIFDYWKSTLNLTNLNPSNKELILQIAEKAKIDLTNTNLVNYNVTINQHVVNLTLNLETYSSLANPFIDKTILSLNMALKDANLTPNSIEHVVLVGGSTKSKLVKDRLYQIFNKEIINSHINPDEIVALGAAIEADILAGNRKNTLLLDVTPLSLGIETMGGLMDVLITRNSKIPTSVIKEYTTSKDGQIRIQINVYQGERELVNENRKLGEFILNNIPPMPAGLPKIEIKFILDANGQLKVKALEKRSGLEQTIEIKPSYGLTDAEVELMLLDSLKNAKTDIEQRLQIESQNEADQIIYTTERFIIKHQLLLSKEEVNKVELAINNLKLIKETTDRNKINLAIESLNDISKPFAERIMNHAVSQNLAGKKI